MERNTKTNFDRHHLLHDSKSWRARVSSRMLRSIPSLIPEIDRDVHEYLHRTTPPVPVPSFYTLDETAKLFIPTGDFFQDVDGLCRSIDFVTNYPKSFRIERELGGLTIEVLQMQKNILREYGVNG